MKKILLKILTGVVIVVGIFMTALSVNAMGIYGYSDSDLYYFTFSPVVRDYMNRPFNADDMWGFFVAFGNNYSNSGNYSYRMDRPPVAPTDANPHKSSITQSDYTYGRNINRTVDYPYSTEGGYNWSNGYWIVSTVGTVTDDISGGYVTESFTNPDYTNFGSNRLTTNVEFDETTGEDVKISVDTQSLKDNYSAKFTRQGSIVDSTKGPSLYGLQPCGWYRAEDPNPNPCTPAYGQFYKDGYTYTVLWTSDWSASDPVLTRTSTEAHSDATSYVKRPMNSDIIYLTNPHCTSGQDDGWFTTTAWIDCYTYGLSADGRTGTAHFHKEDSGWGWFSNWFFVIPFNLGLPFDPVLNNNAPWDGPVSAGDAVLQYAAMPGAYGTVENSNNLGVGGWTWTGGFKLLPPKVELKANNSTSTISMWVPNTSTKLDWNTKYAKNCRASGDWNGNKDISGSESLGALERGTETPGQGKTYTYTLTCDGIEVPTTTSATVNVKVLETPICNFSANPSRITLPEYSNLQWSCQYANTCRINKGVGTVCEDKNQCQTGTRVIRPTTDTTYTLSCDGIDNNVSADASVDVYPFNPNNPDNNPNNPNNPNNSGNLNNGGGSNSGSGNGSGSGSGSNGSTSSGTVRIIEVRPR